MGSSNISDIIAAFSPSSDFLAIISGDGRIKVWDTIKSTLFADIPSTDSTDLIKESGTGHLLPDYTCMKWLPLEEKKKKKVGSKLLVLGTGSGDILALDVSAGQLKWRSIDCHPGGVNAMSFSTQSSRLYTAGVDGMICQTDPETGSLLAKFKASTKAISSTVISADGKIFATAAAQLKIFNCSDNKKIQKFSGYLGTIRCMIFSEDGKYVLSSAVGEKHIAVWKIDGGKQSASCALSMEHPAVFLDSKCRENEKANDGGIYVLAVSEMGSCYLWYGRNIDELCLNKPTIFLLSTEASFAVNQESALPMIFGAELQGFVEGSYEVLVAYGSVKKMLFEKVLVTYGVDLVLEIIHDEFLLPIDQSYDSHEDHILRNEAKLEFIKAFYHRVYNNTKLNIKIRC